MFIARGLDIDVASDGDTEEEALANLREALKLFFECNAEAAFRESESEDADAADDEESGESDY